MKINQKVDIYTSHPDLPRLAKALQRARGSFALFFVECNLVTLRHDLANALATRLSPSPIQIDLNVLGDELQHQHLDELLTTYIQTAMTDVCVFLFGLETLLPTQSIAKRQITIQQLNWRRGFFARLQRPLVIWLPKYAMDILAEQTPDFYDWYSGIFIFKSNAMTLQQAETLALQALSASDVHYADYSSTQDKQQWLHILKSLLAEHSQQDATRTQLLVNTARLLSSLSIYNEALTHYQQALSIQQEIGDKSGEGSTLNNIGLIHKNHGDYDTALHYYQQSLAIRQHIGDKSGEGVTLNNIAAIHQARGDYDTALQYYQQSLVITQHIGDKSGEGTTLNNIGQIHKARGDYDTALHYYQQSLAIQQHIGNKHGEGATLNNIAGIHQARGDYDTALDFLKKSLAIRQEIGDVAGLCPTLFNIATINWQKGEKEEAKRSWIKVYRIAQQINLAQALQALEKWGEYIGLDGGLQGWEELAQQMGENE